MRKTKAFLMRSFALGALLALVFVSPMFGQDANNQQPVYAAGKPETVLSGIDVCSTPMWKVYDRLGVPQRTEHPRIQPEYIWERGRVRLIASEYYYLDGLVPNWVEVSGKAPVGDIGKTGRGLALGATLSDVRRIYGGNFPVDVYRGVRQVVIEWEKSSEVLYITLDKKDRVVGIKLQAGFCNPP